MYKLLRSDFIRKVIEIICVILGLVNIYIPKNKNIILFFENKEVYLKKYAMYQYMNENNLNKKYKIYYPMPALKNTLNHTPKNVAFISGFLKTAIIYLTSS